MNKIVSILMAVFLIIGCGERPSDDEISTTEEIKMLQDKINKFVPVEIQYNEDLLDDREKVVLEKLYQASKIIDELFLEQVYSKNQELRSDLLSKIETETDADKKLEHELQLELFKIMFGPFDRLDNDKPFMGDNEKPLGANYYPEDMTKEEFENWIKANPADEKLFTNEFTVIRRDGDGLKAIPYNEYYKDKLTEISMLLKEAASYADNPSLKKYLNSRADAFFTNDYFQSDMDWMDLKDHKIEVVIGPYEVYEDGLFNYKAAFESFVTIKDPEETKKLQIFENFLDDIENNLPIPDEHKNYQR